MSSSESTKVIIFALVANLGIAIAKFVGASFTHSASLLAEAIHSLVDCTNQVLLLIGQKKAKKPPSVSHPLGYGRESFFWSFIVAILLFSLGGLFAIYEGIHKLHDNPEQGPIWVGITILIFSIGLEGFSFKKCLDEVIAQNPYKSLWEWFRKTTASDLLVIFTEDLAALVGLCLALICLLISWFTKNPMWDALGSILIGTVLVSVAVLLAIEIKSLIIGEAPSEELQADFEKLLLRKFDNGKLFRFIALQLGPNEIMVSAKIYPGHSLDLKAAIQATNDLEVEFKKLKPQVRWQFIELDDKD